MIGATFIRHPVLVTVNCLEGRHDACRCVRPGQNRLMAGVILGQLHKSQNVIPIGRCTCSCHDGDNATAFITEHLTLDHVMYRTPTSICCDCGESHYPGVDVVLLS